MARPIGDKTRRKMIQGVIDAVGNGVPLDDACQVAGMTRMEFMRGVADDPQLWKEYELARATRGDVYAQRVLDIAAAVETGSIPHNAGRAAMEAYKWAASKMARPLWGDDPQSAGVSITIGSDAGRMLVRDEQARRIALRLADEAPMLPAPVIDAEFEQTDAKES